MKLIRTLLLSTALLLSLPVIASAQVATGTPPFGSFGGSSVDTINLANLNAHISIPTLSKAGRGLSFSHPLGYDTSIWYPSSSSGSTVWTPVSTLGWTGTAPVQAGLNSDSVSYTRQTCWETVNQQVSGYWFYYANYAYHDLRGTSHPFSGTAVSPYPLCMDESFSGFTATSTDGAGHSISVNSKISAPITVRTGKGLAPVSPNSSSGADGSTDTNGNEITTGTSGVITDTLGNTLTIAGSGTPSSPLTLTYTAPSGASAVYTVKYTAYTVRTNFGCSGISEYGPTSIDLVSEIDLPDQAVVSSDKYTFTYEATPGYSGDVTGRLASVTFPTGGTISYTYSGGSNGIVCADGSTATLERLTPDTGSNYWTYAHSESGTAWTTTITDPQSNQTVMNFQGIYPTESQVYQGSTSGTLLKTTYTCYNGSASPCNSTAITLPITQNTSYTQWPGSSGPQSKTVTSYNSYGLVTEKDEYAYGAGSPGSVVRKTLTTYASLTNGIVNRPASVTVEDGSGNVRSRTTYCYDEGTPSGTTTCNAAGSPTTTSGTPQHVSITGSRGNVTTVTSLVSGTTTLGKTYTYYDTGNVNVATDANGAQTTFSYGSGSCGNSFVTSVAEPLSLSKSMTWNCTGGVMLTATDENSQTASRSYTDAYFWRPNSATDQQSNVTNFTYTGQISVESSMVFNSSGSTTDALSTVDGLGRKHVSQKKEGPGSSTYDSVETDFDSDGRPDRTTLPYSGTSGQTSSSAPATDTTYDALGRKSVVTDSGGRDTAIAYSQNDTYVSSGPAPSGENAKRKQLEYDALGRLTSVCEITSSAGSGTCGQTTSYTGFWTEYAYDLNNDLTGVAQNAQSSTTQTRTYVYDDLGRMTSETNPESGTTSYTFDTDSTCGTSKGDLVKKIDAVGNTICYAYDALHRLTSVTYPSGSYSSVTPSRYFIYDAATVNSVTMVDVKSRLAEAYTCTSCPATKLTDDGFSYTARGETSDIYESTPHSSAYYHVNQTYWANGSVDKLSGLSGLPTITYGVDGEGRIYSASASSGQNPLSSTSYNFASLPSAVNLGSSDSDSFTYDPNTDRMTEYHFTVNSQSITGTLTWNDIGTLASLAVVDPFNSTDVQTCSYSHDDLRRIASANCGSVWSQTFSYDAFGNIQKSGSMSFGAEYSTSTNRMTLIGSSIPTYDSNGNVTNDFLNTYAWDANDRPVTADSVGLTYDALGRMVEQNRSGAYTQIVYTPSGAKLALMTGSTLQKGYVPLTGGSMAVYNSSGLAYYRHSDWIGSSRFASTPSRTMYSDGAYGPFGEPYAQTGTADASFTGMNQDTATSMYDFPAREYGTQGRWPSPDPAGISSASLKNPQTWNRYAYVGNNPLALTDPSGMEPIARTVVAPTQDPNVRGGGGGGILSGGGDEFDALFAAAALSGATGQFVSPNLSPYDSNIDSSGGVAGSAGAGGSSGGNNSDPANANSNPCGTCVYLDNEGDGFNPKEGAQGGGIDPNSNANECQQEGGVFTTGDVGSVLVDQNSNLVLITPQNGWTYAAGVPGSASQIWNDGANPGIFASYIGTGIGSLMGNTDDSKYFWQYAYGNPCAGNSANGGALLGILSLVTAEFPPLPIVFGVGGIGAGYAGMNCGK